MLTRFSAISNHKLKMFYKFIMGNIIIVSKTLIFYKNVTYIFYPCKVWGNQVVKLFQCTECKWSTNFIVFQCDSCEIVLRNDNLGWAQARSRRTGNSEYGTRHVSVKCAVRKVSLVTSDSVCGKLLSSST